MKVSQISLNNTYVYNNQKKSKTVSFKSSETSDTFEKQDARAYSNDTKTAIQNLKNQLYEKLLLLKEYITSADIAKQNYRKQYKEEQERYLQNNPDTVYTEIPESKMSEGLLELEDKSFEAEMEYQILLSDIQDLHDSIELLS